MKTKENKQVFDHNNVWKTLMKVSFPIVIMQVMFSLFTVVDSLMVSHYVKYSNGTTGSAVIGLAVTPIYIAYVFMTLAIVGNSLNYTKLIAKGKYDEARHSASQGYAFSIMMGLIAGILLASTAYPYMRWVGTSGDEKLTGEQIWDGTLYIIIFSVSLLFPEDFFISTLRTEGKGGASILFPVISIAFNTFFNWLFMGVFNYGIWSASLALLISIFVSTVGSHIYAIYLRRKGKVQLEISFRSMIKTDWKLIKTLSSYGIVAVARSFAFSLNSWLIAVLISPFGNDWRSWLTALSTTFNLFAQVAYGIHLGASTLITYWYNADKKKATKDVIRQSLYATVGVQIIMISIMCGIAPYILRAYNVPNEEVFRNAIYIVSISLLFSSINGFPPFMYSSFKDVKSAMIHISIWIALILTFQLSFYFGFNAVDPNNHLFYIMSLPIGLASSVLVNTPLFINKYKSI